MKTPSLEIRASANPAPAGYVYFNALMPPDITGTIDWFVDQAYATSSGMGSSNGLLTLQNINITPAGNHLVTAVYRGDSNYEPVSMTVKHTST